MNILDKINQERKARHWTEYQLAEKADIPQSTISSWYRNNSLPSFPSLEKICGAFGLTLSEFFLESDSSHYLMVTEQQLRLIQYAAKLSDEQYEKLLLFLQTL